MPSIKIGEKTIKPEYLEKIRKITAKTQEWIDTFKAETLQTIEETFWIKPNLEDPRISESPKLI